MDTIGEPHLIRLLIMKNLAVCINSSALMENVTFSDLMYVLQFM